MPQTYRVRYSLKPSGHHHGGADVRTADIQADLDHIPGAGGPDTTRITVEAGHLQVEPSPAAHV